MVGVPAHRPECGRGGGETPQLDEGIRRRKCGHLFGLASSGGRPRDASLPVAGVSIGSPGRVGDMQRAHPRLDLRNVS
jgi:hypothetical protein